MKNKYNCIDLFTGAGGFFLGFQKNKFNILFSVDNWDPAIKTHLKNFPHSKIINKDISSIDKIEIQKEIKDKIVDVIVGGPPCQGFSTIGKRNLLDPRNKLVFEYIRFVKTLKPKVFLMENVRGMLSLKNKPLVDEIYESFREAGYSNVKSKIICAADYGVPQLRHRVFFIGSRDDLNQEIDFPKPTHSKNNYVKLQNTIMDLVGKENMISNHIPMKHNNSVIERIKLIKEGGGIHENIPKHLLKGTRSDFQNNTIKNFSHIYKRLHREKPSTTMVPGHNAFPLHPTENRSLTVREAARIQTFPDFIEFVGTRQEQCILVGNAVPYKLSTIFAQHIHNYLDTL